MGWIQPLSKVAHQEASKHGGRIYLAQQDIAAVGQGPARVKEGRVVDFLVYSDSDGLGAEDCRQRSVLRMTLPHAEARQKLKDSPQWSEYLTDSEHYPAFEREHGVLLRKYAWPLPFVLVELWGHTEELAAAAVALAEKGSSGSSLSLRLLVSEDDLSKAKSLPVGAKVSEAPAFSRPLPCHEVTVEGSKETCCEVVRSLVAATMASSEAEAEAEAKA